jgi:hypothetical protein
MIFKNSTSIDTVKDCQDTSTDHSFGYSNCPDCTRYFASPIQESTEAKNKERKKNRMKETNKTNSVTLSPQANYTD